MGVLSPYLLADMSVSMLCESRKITWGMLLIHVFLIQELTSEGHLTAGEQRGGFVQFNRKPPIDFTRTLRISLYQIL